MSAKTDEKVEKKNSKTKKADKKTEAKDDEEKSEAPPVNIGWNSHKPVVSFSCVFDKGV